MSAHTPTPELDELVRLRDYDLRQSAQCARLGCAEAAKDYSDSAKRLTSEISVMRIDARKRLTPMIRKPRRAALAKAVA